MPFGSSVGVICACRHTLLRELVAEEGSKCKKSGGVGGGSMVGVSETWVTEPSLQAWVQAAAGHRAQVM